MSPVSDFWAILSSISTAVAVLVALGLSIFPGLWKRHKEATHGRKVAQSSLQNIHYILESYRFYANSFEIVHGVRLRTYSMKTVDRVLQFSALDELEQVGTQLRKFPTEKRDDLLEILSVAKRVFSGFPVPLIDWYYLEAKIAKFCEMPTELKKYNYAGTDLFLDQVLSNQKKLVYKCIGCTNIYSLDEEFDSSNLNSQERVVQAVFGTAFCPECRIPLQVEID